MASCSPTTDTAKPRPASKAQSIEDSGRAARTKREYRDTWNRYLVSSVNSLRIRDVRVSTVNRVITKTRDHVGRGAVSHVKVVLSGIFAFAVRQDAPTSIDFDAGTIRFHGTVIQVAGQGLFVQDHTKSRAGMRTVRPPGWGMEILTRRHANSESEWVFPSAPPGR